MRTAFPGSRYLEVGPELETSDDVFQRVNAAVEACDVIVAAVVVKPAAWRAFGLPARQQAFVQELTARRPVILVSLGSPVVLQDVPGAAARLCTYSDVPASQAALAAYLAGRGPQETK